MNRRLLMALPVLSMLTGCGSPDNGASSDTPTTLSDGGADVAPGTITDPTTDVAGGGIQPGAVPQDDREQGAGQTLSALPPVNDEEKNNRGAGSSDPNPGRDPPFAS